MRQFISIGLIALVLAWGFLDLHDLTKIPYLVQHYQQHQKKSSGVSFIEFLNLHYGSKAERHDKEEHEKHSGLPFKSLDCTSSHITTLVPFFKAPEITSVGSVVSYNNFYQSAFFSDFSQSIWQPPKQS